MNTQAAQSASDPPICNLQSPICNPPRGVLGVGGIGSGSFFLLNGDHTLGREESRTGRYLDRRDYCKLHIVCHTLKALLEDTVEVLPIGRVGDDDPGRRLLREMEDAGLCLEHVGVSHERPTLFSFCFLYPDGSGGNLTTADSACAEVTPEVVAEAEPDFQRFAGRGIALALPEVPLPAREAVLRLATRHRLLRVASFATEEMPDARALLGSVDILAVNLDEAAALAALDAGCHPPEAIVDAAVAAASAARPAIRVTITAGGRGSWSWDGCSLLHRPALPVAVAGTAGAGDAHLAGVLAGLAAGLPLADAHALGSLAAAFSVTSPHTIHPSLTRASLHRFASEARASLPDSVRRFLAP